MSEIDSEEITSACPKIEDAFQLLSRKWVGLIIRVLMNGEKHFCDLERLVPNLSPRVLSVRMKELEEEGIVVRMVQAGPPIRVSYTLTQKGQALEPVIQAIGIWAYSF